MTERLQKVLARAGIASRRESEKMIESGRITVNGALVTTPGFPVDAEHDEIKVDGSRIRDERLVYWLVNKPKGVVCTMKDPEGRPRVVDLVPDRHRVVPVGRLDEEDSEGLIIVTNDGDLTNLVTHPRYGIEKVYAVRVRGVVVAADTKRLEGGVWLSEGKTQPVRVRIRKRGKSVTHLELTLTEGRNREIRRMLAKIDRPVLSLRRIRIGSIKDPNMKPGTCRRLTLTEVRELKEYAAGKRPPPKKKKKPLPRRRR
jgi:23S rRNA pseudouridine2605 synthase